MPPRRPVAAFIIRLAIVYALGLLLWPVVGACYAGAIRGVANFTTRIVGVGASVQFNAAPPETEFDIEIQLTNRTSQMQGLLPFKSRDIGWIPTIVVVSLIAATPLPWRRLRSAALWGVGLIQLYIAFRIALMILASFSGHSPLAAFSLGGFGDGTLQFLSELFSRSLMGGLLGPIIIWIAVTFRRGDWQLISHPPPNH